MGLLVSILPHSGPSTLELALSGVALLEPEALRKGLLPQLRLQAHPRLLRRPAVPRALSLRGLILPLPTTAPRSRPCRRA